MNNFDFACDKALTKNFLTNFADSLGEPKYLKILQDVANRKSCSVTIAIDDLFNLRCKDLEEILIRVTENSRRYISIFAEAADELMPEPTEVFSLDEDHDILMTQRADDRTDSVDNSDPLQKMPPEIKRF